MHNILEPIDPGLIPAPSPGPVHVNNHKYDIAQRVTMCSYRYESWFKLNIQ